MIYQHIDRDSYTDSQNAERVLNAAIIGAEIADSYEEYLDIFEAFYADEIEVSGDTQSQPIRGKARVRALLFNFLVPLHVMAEVGGLSISIRETPIPGDAADETHSAWTLDLAGGSGAVCTLNWCVRPASAGAGRVGLAATQPRRRCTVCRRNQAIPSR
jgi:hypothetical protein